MTLMLANFLFPEGSGNSHEETSPFVFRLVLEDHNVTLHCYELTIMLLKVLHYSFHQFAQSQRRCPSTILALNFFTYNKRLPSTRAMPVCVCVPPCVHDDKENTDTHFYPCLTDYFEGNGLSTP